MRDEETAKHWLGKLTRLNPATGRGICRGKAPHKPLLLLALLDLAESGELTSRSITRSPGLVLRFRNYGTITADRWPTRLDVKMPFYYLKSQGFWEAFTVEMRSAASPETCSICELNPQLYDLLFDAGFRLKARMVLITKYFDRVEQVGLFESLGLQVGFKASSTGDRLLREATDAAAYKGRSARFAVRVVAEYRYTCALTGYRCITDDGSAIVDAAHIEEWSKTRNDELENGLALSKSAHWMFDEGLWSVDKNLCVLVNQKRFTENGAEALRLTSYAGRHLQFDPASRLRPAQGHFYSHRLRHGFPS